MKTPYHDIYVVLQRAGDINVALQALFLSDLVLAE